MARSSKIEQHGLEDKILKLRNNDKAFNEIVDIFKKITLNYQPWQ
ncbi:hypothetical protein ACF3M2_16535 [Tissierella carlieri]|jgi:hypothetical protein